MNPKPAQDQVSQPSGGSGPEQDVTRIIADVENQLLRLKEADTQRKALAVELQERDAQLASTRAELEQARAQFETQTQERAALEQRVHQLEAELQQAREHLEAQAEQRGGLDDRIAALDAELTQARADVQQARDELAEQTQKRTDLEERVTQLAAEHEAQRDELNRLTKLADEQQQAIEAERQAHQTTVDETLAQSREELNRARAQIADAETKAEELARQRDEAARDLASAQSRADRLRTELDSARSEQGSDVRELSARVEQAAQDRDRLRIELELVTSRIDEITEQRDELRAQNAELNKKIASATPTNTSGRPMAPTRVASRMRRLANVRSALGVRARKLRRAGEVLQQRVEQCDLLLQQRRELAAAKRALDVLHERVESSKARSSSIVQLTAWLVTLSVLAGGSWLIAGRMAPASFSSTAVLAAEEIAPGVGDVEAWTEFHVGLLDHPRLIERVAARLQRRGMTDDGAVAAVRTMVEERVIHRSTQPGRLEIEVVGEGKARSKRWLETYITALVAEANESRPRRRDGLSTAIEQEPVTNPAPIEDPRPRYAGIGLAAAASVAALLWFGLWRAMARVRSRYEQSSRLDEILSEARWMDPVPDVARRAPRG